MSELVVDESNAMVNWQEIELVLLDMDGTLLDLHFDNYFWLEHVPVHYAQLHQLELEEASARLYAQFRAHEGKLQWYSLDYWSDCLKLDIVALKQEVRHKIAYRPEVENFLRQLRATGKRAVIVTNADQGSLQLKIESTAIDRQVDRIISSHDLELPKEDPRFWHALHQLEPICTQNTLFIDDNLQVLRAARGFGIRHLLTILQPDSRQAPRTLADEFAAIRCFSQICL